MKALKIATVLPWLLLVSGVLMAATQYGEATVEEGSMLIVREGQTLRFDQVKQTVPVNEDDLIRVRPASRVILKSRENATLTLGANAVFQVKPWQARGKSGFLRALFGRFRASIVGLSGGEQFNVKTATATIGVKGTEYLSSITTRGGTMLVVTDNDPELHGQVGPPVNVLVKQISLVININRPTPPAAVPPEVQLEFDKGLDSPAANSRAARNFPGQRGLVNAGIVTDDDLREGQGDDSRPTPRGRDRSGSDNPNVDPNEGAGVLGRGNVPLRFR